jgi:hypothetical protein
MQSMRRCHLHFGALLVRALFCSIAADRDAAPPPLTAVIQLLPTMVNRLQIGKSIRSAVFQRSFERSQSATAEGKARPVSAYAHRGPA